MKTIREFVEAAKGALDAIDGAATARQMAEDARKATANAKAEAARITAARDNDVLAADQALRRMQKQLADLQTQIEQERIVHETNLRTARERSQEQINKASETLEKINKDIGLKRAEHDELVSAISRMKALAADLAKS